MDLPKLIEVVGLQRVEEFLKIYVSFGNDKPPLVEGLLDILNHYCVPFDATRREPVVSLDDLKDFLLCVAFFRTCFRL